MPRTVARQVAALIADAALRTSRRPSCPRIASTRPGCWGRPCAEFARSRAQNRSAGRAGVEVSLVPPVKHPPEVSLDVARLDKGFLRQDLARHRDVQCGTGHRRSLPRRPSGSAERLPSRKAPEARRLQCPTATWSVTNVFRVKRIDARRRMAPRVTVLQAAGPTMQAVVQALATDRWAADPRPPSRDSRTRNCADSRTGASE